MPSTHTSESNPSRERSAPTVGAVARRPGGRLARLAQHPVTSGLVAFFTTAMMLLPVEYEAPLRSALFLLSTRGR